MNRIVILVLLVFLVGCQSNAPLTNPELHAQINDLNNEVIGYLDELDLKQSKIDELEAELAKLYDEIDELESRNNKIDNDLLEMVTIIEVQKAELEILKESSTEADQNQEDNFKEKRPEREVEAYVDESSQYAIEIEGHKLWIDRPESAIPYVKLHIDNTLVENTAFGTGGSKSIKKCLMKTLQLLYMRVLTMLT